MDKGNKQKKKMVVANSLPPDIRREWLKLRLEIDLLSEKLLSDDISSDKVKAYTGRILELESLSGVLLGMPALEVEKTRIHDDGKASSIENRLNKIALSGKRYRTRLKVKFVVFFALFVVILFVLINKTG